MLQFYWRICCLSLSLLLPLSGALQKEEGSDDDPGLGNYVSRPDIKAPKWEIKTYDEDRIAPGYWFVGPYRILKQETFGHGWVGAHIYDQKGELIWSGASMFSKGNIEDFRMSNVNGENLMTLMDQGRGEGIIFDNHYEIRDVIHMDHFNSHEFNFVENGTRTLVIKGNHKQATEEMSKKVGYHGRCGAAFDGFQELDVTNNYEPTFDWSSWDWIGLDESTLTEGSVNNRCGGNWDFLHSNSVDKTREGDYIFSGRHTDTIYKISKEDGHIIWRLGGVKSDFPISDEFKFSRQHDVRIRDQNDTHLVISILDNAKGIDHTAPPTHDFSRGLLIAVNEKDMEATIELQIDHPDGKGGYSPRRGNYQLLENGNIFMGWSEEGVQSEHAPDGTMLFEAKLAVNWLGTYRQYKFPYVGEPTDPPDVHAEAIGTGNGTTTTVVHVSWNGATEVASWDLYKSTPEGDNAVLLASADKLGFETVLAHNSFASHVLVKAIDKDGNILGSSGVFETIIHDNVTDAAIEAEDEWLTGPGDTPHRVLNKAKAMIHNPIAAFFVGFIASAVMLLIGWHMKERGLLRFIRRARYHRLRQDKDEPTFAPYTEVADDAVPLRTRKESFDEGA